jgi:hypothetical protein
VKIKIAMFFHGSNRKDLTRLDPFPSNVLKGKKAVFATPSFYLACCFINDWKDEEISLGYYGDSDTLWLEELRPNALVERFSGAGVVYTVDAKSFHKSEEVGLKDHELVSDTAVDIMEIIPVTNPLLVLQQAGEKKVKIVPFAERTKEEEGFQSLSLQASLSRGKKRQRIDDTSLLEKAMIKRRREQKG